MSIVTCQACGGPKTTHTHCGSYCIECSIEYIDVKQFCGDVEYCELCKEIDDRDKENSIALINR